MARLPSSTHVRAPTDFSLGSGVQEFSSLVTAPTAWARLGTWAAATGFTPPFLPEPPSRIRGHSCRYRASIQVADSSGRDPGRIKPGQSAAASRHPVPGHKATWAAITSQRICRRRLNTGSHRHSPPARGCPHALGEGWVHYQYQPTGDTDRQASIHCPARSASVGTTATQVSARTREGSSTHFRVGLIIPFQPLGCWARPPSRHGEWRDATPRDGSRSCISSQPLAHSPGWGHPTLNSSRRWLWSGRAFRL